MDCHGDARLVEGCGDVRGGLKVGFAVNVSAKKVVVVWQML